MCDRERDELDIEFYARFDYIAELKAEHAETKEQLDAEAAWYAELEAAEAAAFIGPRDLRQRLPAKVWTTDDIPF
jgi:hypothetical protein